jgi:hypothetical protein
MTHHVNVSGVWKECIPHVKVAGVWKAVDAVWTKVAGTWKQIYTSVVISITDQSVADSAVGSVSSADYQVLNTGVVKGYLLNGGGLITIENWITPQTNMSDYTVRAHVNSGTAPSSGDALDSDLNLGTSRTWTQTQASPGTRSCILLITIKRVADGATMDTALVTLEAAYF